MKGREMEIIIQGKLKQRRYRTRKEIKKERGERVEIDMWERMEIDVVEIDVDRKGWKQELKNEQEEENEKEESKEEEGEVWKASTLLLLFRRAENPGCKPGASHMQSEHSAN